MHSTALLSAVLSVLALANAAPTPDIHSRDPAYSAHLKYEMHDKHATRSPGVYVAKLSKDVPSPFDRNRARDIAAANNAHIRSRYSERAEEADVLLTNWRRDYMYTVDLELGTPAQKFTVHVDTGSSSTYILTKNCTVRACKTNNIPLFDFDKSSTFALWNTTARRSLTYGSGYAAGNWVNDSMAIGPFNVEKQAFLGAYNTDAGYVGSHVSGLLGLGFPSLTVAGETPWWTNAMQQWDDKRFGVYLERGNLNEIPPGSEGNQTTGFRQSVGGTLTLGGVSEELFEGEINYVPVTNPNYWMVDFGGAKINGKAVPITTRARTIVDTGSTLNYFPKEYAKAFFAQIPGAVEAPDQGYGMWALPCKTNAKVAFTFNGVDYDIFPDDMNFYVYNETEGTCVSSILGTSPGSVAEFLMGAAFLKNVYSVHQPEPPRLGLAKLKNPGTPYTGWPEFKGNGSIPTDTNTTVPTANSTVSVPSATGNSTAVLPTQTPAGNSTVLPTQTPAGNSTVLPTPSGGVSNSSSASVCPHGQTPITNAKASANPVARQARDYSDEPYWGKDGNLHWRQK